MTQRNVHFCTFEAEPNATLAVVPAVGEPAWIRSERVQEQLPVVLAIEDDHLIQGMFEDALSEGGFDVAIAATGEEAITLLKGRKTEYRALVTDINLLGRLDGWEVARAAR